MKTILEKITNAVGVGEEDFSKPRAITVLALVIAFVGTTFYLMIKCYTE